MRLKKWISEISDQSKDPQERMFVLVVLVAMAALAIIFFVGLFLGESSEDLITLGVAFAVFALFFFLAFHFNKVQFFAKIAATLLTVVVMPVTFITGGGINGGSPLWFVFVALFVSLIISGKMRWVLIGITMISIGVCYYIQYCHPEMITGHSDDMAFQDSLISLVIVCLMVCIMVRYQILILKEAYKRADDQRKEIDELNKAQNRFFSSMSHEIRTPINTIIGLNEMILREEISDEVAEDANNVRSAGKILLHLINDILDMSKFESGKMELTPTKYNIGEMISELVGMFWMRAKEKGLEFHVEIDPDVPMELYGDEVRIEQILINLLNNAIKYTHDGSVTFSVQHRRIDEKHCQIIYNITDTGIGIKKESIPHLFSAFRRINETETKYIEGTGLGLAIVKQLVDLMNGTVTVNSVYTKGTTFIITLPQELVGDAKLSNRHFDVESRTGKSRNTQYESLFEAPEAKVLVVDDNMSNLLVVSKLLRDTKMLIDTVQSGSEALEKTLMTEYDLIFLDHLMPDMDGIETLHCIRNQVGGLCKGTKAVVLTANSDLDDKSKYYKEGFDGYLLKPTSGEMLERECIRLLPKEMVHAVFSDDQIVEESMSWLNEHERKEEILITTDSVADLPLELLQKYRIEVLPHKVLTDEGVFTDGNEIEAQGLINYMEEDGNSARNVHPTVEDYEEFFARQLSRADNIIHISISSKITSSAFIAANEASKAFDNVSVIDSRHLSSGQGLMVLDAAHMVREGKNVETIKELLKEHRYSYSTSFVVCDLEYLAKSGQVDNRMLKITKALMVRPVLRMKNGKLKVDKVFFGSQQNSWGKYISSELRFHQNIDKKLLFVTYVGMSQNELDIVKAEIEKRTKFEKIIFQKASPVIALNCGPGTFGLLYRRKAKTEMGQI